MGGKQRKPAMKTVQKHVIRIWVTFWIAKTSLKFSSMIRSCCKNRLCAFISNRYCVKTVCKKRSKKATRCILLETIIWQIIRQNWYPLQFSDVVAGRFTNQVLLIVPDHPTQSFCHFFRPRSTLVMQPFVRAVDSRFWFCSRYSM